MVRVRGLNSMSCVSHTTRAWAHAHSVDFTSTYNWTYFEEVDQLVSIEVHHSFPRGSVNVVFPDASDGLQVKVQLYGLNEQDVTLAHSNEVGVYQHGHGCRNGGLCVTCLRHQPAKCYAGGDGTHCQLYSHRPQDGHSRQPCLVGSHRRRLPGRHVDSDTAIQCL